MSAAPGEFVVRRIVVAVDASPPSLEALEEAAKLAARTEAELLGLFVEDVNLLRLARLPFVRQVSGLSGLARPFDEMDLEAQMRVLAARARQAMSLAIERLRFRGSFRVVRGSVSAEVLAAAQEADLLILGWGSGPLSRPRLGGTARAAAERAGKPVLLVRAGLDLGHLVVVYDDSPGADRALAAAVCLAEAGRGELEVVVSADSGEEAARLEGTAAAGLARRGRAARLAPVVGAPDEALRRILRTAGRGLLVLSADSSLLHPERAVDCLEESGRPVLLVR